MPENTVPTIADLRAKNLNSLDVITKALQRLKELRRGAAISPVLQDHIDAEISTLELELTISTIVQTRLQAASVVVKPLSEADAGRLEQLAATIDEAIERDTVVTASLVTVESFVKTATSVRDLVKASAAAA
ncbi:hypothetical protein [uncultured Paludibaculum sp.]|uniref:hypothetical protein n=1 Tax=uncultured Paludibaculum sp. TaxID=1765020 RepID=UPI002AABB3B2|nr:hypothetical protein [uncultured Paludibaculum sp.]